MLPYEAQWVNSIIDMLLYEEVVGELNVPCFDTYQIPEAEEIMKILDKIKS